MAKRTKKRWSACQSDGCKNPGTVRYTREVRGPKKTGISSRRRLYLCGKHDYQMRTAWSTLFSSFSDDGDLLKPCPDCGGAVRPDGKVGLYDNFVCLECGILIARERGE